LNLPGQQGCLLQLWPEKKQEISKQNTQEQYPGSLKWVSRDFLERIKVVVKISISIP